MVATRQPGARQSGRGDVRVIRSGPPSVRTSPARRPPPEQIRRRAFALLGLSVVVPGSAQLVAGTGPGRRQAGRIALRVWAGCVGFVLLVALGWLVHREWVLGLFTHQSILRLMALVLVAMGVGWPLLVIDAWRLADVRPLTVAWRRRIAVLAVFLVLATLMLPVAAARRVWAGADLLGGIFGSGRRSAAVQGRYNVLLLGGDAGPERVGTRPDSVTLASVDENTGRTVLISLPRNLQNVPFPPGSRAAAAMPRGWSCGDDCLLNAIYQWGARNRQYFPGAADPGAEAMKQAVQAVTGLTVNYYVLIDLTGFRSLIDAVGGIDLDVTTRVPIGGGTSPIHSWIEPGRRHLNGFHALWYGRSREGSSDYERMARQRCVMTAMVNQLDPPTLLRKFQGIAAAGRQVVSTDIPAGQLPEFLTLGQQAKSHRIDSVQFVPPLIVPHHPDYAVIRSRVAQAVAASSRGADPSPTAAVVKEEPPVKDTKKEEPQPSATTAGQPVVDVRQVCRAA